MLQTKSVNSPAKPDDGLRILVTRFRGRGLEASRYDVWMPNLGPTEKLLAAVRAGEVTWSEFRRRYKKELFSSSAVDDDNRTIKNHGQKFTLRLIRELSQRETVTLMCHCDEDAEQCHRFVLRDILKSSQI